MNWDDFLKEINKFYANYIISKKIKTEKSHTASIRKLDRKVDEQIRLVGIGLIVSALMFMIYEVVQIGLELPTDNPTSFTSNMTKIGIKIVAILPALFIGVLLLKYFSNVKKIK